MSVAADGEPDMSHLVFVASRLPVPSTTAMDSGWIAANPHLLVDEHGRYGIDNDWWFEAEAKRLFSGEVLEHLRRHPRRPMPIAAATEPSSAAAWRTFPTSVLLGRDDHLISEADRHTIETKVPDVRYLDTDHFILFHQPETVAETILEFLHSARAR